MPHSLTRSACITFTFHALLLVSLLVTQAHGQSQNPLSVQKILEMTPNEASKGLPIELRGVVTESVEQGMIVHDSTAGIWIYTNESQVFHPGDEVEVRGKISSGMFAPVINASRITKLGSSPLPPPSQASFMQLSSGDFDGQYVQADGTIRAVGLQETAPESKRLHVKLKMDDGVLTVTLPASNLDAMKALIDARVRITGTAMCSKNDSRQIITPDLATGGMEQIEILKQPPLNLFALPQIPVNQLMQYRSGTSYERRVHVSGIVTYFEPGRRLTLESSGAALYIDTLDTLHLSPGDRVEVVGYPAPSRSGPILEDATVKLIARGPPPLPTQVAFSEICNGQLSNNLVSVKAHLLREVHEPARDVLLLQNGPRVIVSELLTDGKIGLPSLAEGSTIAVTGINTLEVGGDWNYGADSAEAVRCTLLLRNPEDAQVVAPPSWWSARHLVYISTGLALLMLAFLGQTLMSRAQQWRLKAVMKERERLAHEMHDTLAQSFAGIGFQLRAIQRSVPDSLPQLRQQVVLADDLVRHSHKEARRSFEAPLAPEELVIDLPVELKQSIHQMLDGGEIHLAFEIIGDPMELPTRTSVELLRIGQEAVANVVRHAAAQHVNVQIEYRPKSVALSVEDDGVGFVKRGDLLGFGLRGMRKRAASIGARLELDSSLGKGTTVKVTAPLHKHWIAFQPARLIWSYFRSLFRHVDQNL